MSLNTLVPKDKLRSDKFGIPNGGDFVTQSLFIEYTNNPKYSVFTLRRDGKEGYLNFSELFLSMTKSDPTEYTFALDVFGSYDHWLAICANKTILPYIERLRKEREVLVKSEALRKIISEANDPKSKNHYAAAKYVLEKGWEKEVRELDGISKKEAKAQREKENVTKRTSSDILEDAERLGLRVM